MAAAKQVGRLAGLAVSVGIGLAVATGVAGEAAAETPDSPSGSAGAGNHQKMKRADDSRVRSRAEARSAAADSARRQATRPTRPSLRGSRSLSKSEAEPKTDAESKPESKSESNSGTDATLRGPTDPATTRRDSIKLPRRGAFGIHRFSPVDRTDLSPASPAVNDAPPRPRAGIQALAAVLGAARPRFDQSLVNHALSARAASVRLPANTTVTAAISAVNTAPTATAAVAAPDGITGRTQVTVTASDIDNDGLTYTAGKAIFGKVANLGDGNFTYTPHGLVRFVGRILPILNADRFSVTITDGQGGTTSVRVNTSIVPLNAAPKLRSTSVGAPNATTGVVSGGITASDPNGDSLSYAESTTVSAKGTFYVNSAGGFTYTPTDTARHAAAATSATTAEKTDTFTVQVVDKYGAVSHIPVTVAIGIANVAPTGSSTVDSPNAVSGIVTGTVLGSDDDSDTLHYGGSTTTLKGTVVVNADGSFVYTPNAYARYNAWHPFATLSDGVDTFKVTGDDGHGGIVTVPVRVEISPSAVVPPPKPASTFCGCTLMPADTIFHADIRGLALLPESDTFIDLLGGSRGETLRAGMGGGEWMGSTGGLPVNVVSATYPRETVIFNRGLSTTGPGIDDRPYAIPNNPLVEGMPSYPAWDRHLFVFQEGTCISQELYNVANGVELPGAGVLDILGNAAYKAIWGDKWIAEAGAQYDMSSALYPDIGHANASRLPFIPLMLKPGEIESGEIDHMMGIAIAKDIGAGYSWPARAGDGSSPDGIPMGTVFRLRSDIDITQYSESTQVVLRALQVHGAVVYDSTGPGSPGAGLLYMNNGWTGTDHLVAASELSTIPMEFFEAVDVSSIAVDAGVGWQTH